MAVLGGVNGVMFEIVGILVWTTPVHAHWIHKTVTRIQ